MTKYTVNEEDHREGAYQEILAALEKNHGAEGQRAVLIADDEASVRRMVSRSMTQLDPTAKIYQAENGQEALELLARIRIETRADPILIVTDLEMPVMDGWEFVERLRQEYVDKGEQHGIPVVVLSSSSGVKGRFVRKSVHGDKSGYEPLVTIAKENCIQPVKYDSQGEQGLATWLKHFLRSSGPR